MVVPLNVAAKKRAGHELRHISRICALCVQMVSNKRC
jgi:hypothetical protein